MAKKEVVHLIECWLRHPGSTYHMDIHANVQLRRKKENNPKPSDLLKHESIHDHCDLFFKSYIKVNNNNKIRQQLQWNDQFLVGKYQYFISTWLFQRHFKLGYGVVVDFYVQKKKKNYLALRYLMLLFLNTELQLRVSVFVRLVRTFIKIIIKSQSTMPNFFSFQRFLSSSHICCLPLYSERTMWKEKSLLKSLAFLVSRFSSQIQTNW